MRLTQPMIKFSSFMMVSIPPLYVLTRVLSLSTTVALYAVRNVASMEMEMAVGQESERACAKRRRLV